MDKNTFQKRFHVLVAVVYIAVHCQFLVVTYNVATTRWDIVMAQYGMGLQFMTMWSMAFHDIYFYYSLKEDQMPSNDPRKLKLQKQLSVAFHSIVFPFTFQLMTMFWPLYFTNVLLLDKHNALPTVLKTVNYSMHLVVALIVILELFLVDRPKNFVSSGTVLINSLLASFTYIFFVFFLNFLSGKWPYPFFGMLTPLQVSLVNIINVIVSVLIWKICCLSKDCVDQRMSNMLKNKKV